MKIRKHYKHPKILASFCLSTLILAPVSFADEVPNIWVVDQKGQLNYHHQDLAEPVADSQSVDSRLVEDPIGPYIIDTLIVLTPDAKQEIVDKGTTPQDYLSWRIEALNKTLLRSQIYNSVVRLVGIHTLTQADFDRTGKVPNGPLANIGHAAQWLSSYRDSYGADKVMLIGANSEPNNNAAYGGGDFSSYFVDFLPIEHEFGHMMGGGHCNEGKPEQLNFGMPLSGYSEAGQVNPGNFGGSRMCGNNVAFYSNPDIELTLTQIEQFVAEGLMPQGDYTPLLNAEGKLKMGDEKYANFAKVWRDNAQAAANRKMATKPFRADEQYYDKDNCAALYSEPYYRGYLEEVCIGEPLPNYDSFMTRSVKLGKNIQVNLYSNEAFGRYGMCGGEVLRSAFSISDLRGASNVRGFNGFKYGVGSAIVYSHDDHVSHFINDGPFEFASSGKYLPTCINTDEDGPVPPPDAPQIQSDQSLYLFQDNLDWSATAALFKAQQSIPFEISFKLNSGHVGPRSHGEGFSFFFAKDNSAYDQAVLEWSDLGFIRDGSGYAVEFHDVHDRVALLDGDSEQIGQAALHEAFTFGQWVEVKIRVNVNNVQVYWNDQLVLNQDVVFEQAHSGIGFGAGTGYYTSQMQITDIEIDTPNCANVAQYEATKVYVGGDMVQSNGVLFQAKWWNINQDPQYHSGQWRVWQQVQSCI